MILEMVIVGLVFFIGLLVGAGMENRDWINNKLPDMYLSWSLQHGLAQLDEEEK